MPGSVPGPCSEHEEEEGRGDGSGDEGGRDDGAHDARLFLDNLGNGRRGGLDGALEEGDVVLGGRDRADGGVVDLANLGASRHLPREAGVDGGGGGSNGAPFGVDFGTNGGNRGRFLGDLTVEDEGAGLEVQGLGVLVDEILLSDDGGGGRSNVDVDGEALAGLDLEGLGDLVPSGIRDGGHKGGTRDPSAFSSGGEAGEGEGGVAGGDSEGGGGGGEDWPVGDGDLPHGGVVSASANAPETEVVDIGSKSSGGNLPREGPGGGTVASKIGGVVDSAERREPGSGSSEGSRGGGGIHQLGLGVLRAGGIGTSDSDGEGTDGDSASLVGRVASSLNGNLVNEEGGIDGGGGSNGVGPLEGEVGVLADDGAGPAVTSIGLEKRNSREGTGAERDIDLDGQVEASARLDNDVAEAGRRGGEAPGGDVECGSCGRELITGHLSDESGLQASASGISGGSSNCGGGLEGEGRESEGVGAVREVEADLLSRGNVDGDSGRSLLPASSLSGGIEGPTVVGSGSGGRHAGVGPAPGDDVRASSVSLQRCPGRVVADGLGHGGLDSNVVGTSNEGVGSSGNDDLSGSVVDASLEGVLRHTEAVGRVAGSNNNCGAVELLAAHKSLISGNGSGNPGDGGGGVDTDNKGVTVVDVNSDLVKRRGSGGRSGSDRIGPNAGSVTGGHSGGNCFTADGGFSPGGHYCGSLGRVSSGRGGDRGVEGSLRGEGLRLHDLSADGTVVGNGGWASEKHGVGAVEIGRRAEFEVRVRSGEIHLVLNGGIGAGGASDEAVSGDVSISAGSSQL